MTQQNYGASIELYFDYVSKLNFAGSFHMLIICLELELMAVETHNMKNIPNFMPMLPECREFSFFDKDSKYMKGQKSLMLPRGKKK